MGVCTRPRVLTPEPNGIDETQSPLLCSLVGDRVVVIEFWHSFMDYNYLSLNRQLLPITITKVAYG